MLTYPSIFLLWFPLVMMVFCTGAYDSTCVEENA